MLNSFNKYLKRSSPTEIIKNIFIILLAFGAFYVIYINILSPLIMNSSSEPGVDETIPFDTMDDTGIKSENTSIKPVERSKLFWNESIMRDPFSYTKLKSNSSNTKNNTRNNTNGGQAVTRRIVHPIKNPVLSGIIKGQDSNFAILNGKVIKEGDIFGGFILLKILKKTVVLEKNSKTITIKMIDGE